ncbi:MAG TPA: N-acetylmuramoyl-L-alanine amidase [Candidatus Copromorpha excrementigallinarum]|uniref:N-acetylmuramoyl-L-alanine amidase n=1 Tax=Candidatus Allocopromorpha excrementigallinarum TaxID=2840742 RepID=A0A9D1L669_9FIRM|nr:N-acetylmuramoyl-L-alanine amidase [Candidatus Copromorpha excrementigallinarum]
MKRRAVIFTAAAAAVFSFCAFHYENAAVFVGHITGKPSVVLDPGHGGIDGGALSSDGTSEKNINLNIAMLLRERLKKEGITVIMTRTEDRGLYGGNEEGAIRSLKTRDMKERRAVIDSSECDLAVSIHLNSFTQDETVKGAQVFYSGGGGNTVAKKSRNAAELLQNKLNRNINEDKKRSELEKNDVFLLQDPVCPTVIVECGFLSNPREAERLKRRSYQKKISTSLAEGISEYICKNSVKDCKNTVSEDRRQKVK